MSFWLLEKEYAILKETDESLGCFQPTSGRCVLANFWNQYFLKRQGWKVTYITVIGAHYQWGGGKKE